VGKEAWARYGMNKARGMAQKQARFDEGEADGRAEALATEAGADRDALQQAATGGAWREAEAATDAARGAAERLAALVTPQWRSRTLPWLALASAPGAGGMARHLGSGRGSGGVRRCWRAAGRHPQLAAADAAAASFTRAARRHIAAGAGGRA